MEQLSGATELVDGGLAIIGLCQASGEGRGKYRGFVAERKNQPSPWGSLKNRVFLGSEQYVEQIKEKLEPISKYVAAGRISR